MPIPTWKQRRYPGATRPWNQPEDREQDPMRLKVETPRMIREREICLSCELPACQQDSICCPLRTWDWRPLDARSAELPPDFAELSKTMDKDQLAEHYHVDPYCISLWDYRLRFGLKKSKLGIPDSFRDCCEDHTIEQLSMMYGVSRSTADRWRRMVRAEKKRP